MNRRDFLKKTALASAALCALPITGCEQNSPKKPNIIVILADDLGYGDVSCYGATEINTPNLDKLADNGIRFTQGYCTSATCTPSRYGLLTGQYPWKNKRAHILPGDAPLIMKPGMTTIPSMLKKGGYSTGVVGKWHLGMGNGNVNWNKTVSPGANDVGFEYSYLLAATQDRVPTVILENQKVVGLTADDPIEVSYKKNFQGEPTGRDNPELLKLHPSHGHDMSVHNGISRIGYQRGGKSALWVDENLADVFTNKAKKYINDHKDDPFFLYFALHQPHVPRTPHARFVGRSGMGPRGDAIIEADWCVGEIVKELKKLKLDKNTLIVFSSDNGPVVDDGYKDQAVEKLGKHTPAGPLRGGKYSLFDAGTRVPFIVSWPGTIKPDTSDALVCQIDLLASFAKLTGQTVTEGADDSKDLLEVLTGKSTKGRQQLILEARGYTCMRTTDWYFIPPHGGARINKQVNIELGNLPKNQLYNINNDIGQLINLAKDHPQIVNELEAQYKKVMGQFYKPFMKK
ncbi:MAG: arylsulfatase [Planctomycetes bacterium]|nr:arylsulfatase [Planctomycetota bacterium]